MTNNTEQPKLPETKPCRYCRHDIHKDASVCQHCNSDQRPIIHWIQDYSIVLSVLILLFGFLQYIETRTERITAEEAMDTAHRTQCDLIRLGFQLIDISNNTFYLLHRVPATTEKDRKKMFQTIDTLRKKLTEEHSEAGCTSFPEMSYPTKTFGIPSPQK